MRIFKLPVNLTSKIDFQKIFQLKPDKYNDVIVYNKETGEFFNKTIFRSYISYLKTPDFDPNTKKSYMFLNKNEKPPELLLPILEYIQKIDSRYNQMVVNWYEPDDYIEMHSDCSSKMLSKDSPILIVNLNENSDIANCRDLVFKEIGGEDFFKVQLRHAYVYQIDNNNTHRHGVGKGPSRRISITFRMMA